MDTKSRWKSPRSLRKPTGQPGRKHFESDSAKDLSMRRALAGDLLVRAGHCECGDTARMRAADFVGRGRSMTRFADGGVPHARRNGPVAETVAPCGRQLPEPAEPIPVSRAKMSDAPMEAGEGTDGLQRLHLV